MSLAIAAAVASALRAAGVVSGGVGSGGVGSGGGEGLVTPRPKEREMSGDPPIDGGAEEEDQGAEGSLRHIGAAVGASAQ